MSPVIKNLKSQQAHLSEAVEVLSRKRIPVIYVSDELELAIGTQDGHFWSNRCADTGEDGNEAGLHGRGL